jgi:membrane-bound lytic murein transglycosylase B
MHSIILPTRLSNRRIIARCFCSLLLIICVGMSAAAGTRAASVFENNPQVEAFIDQLTANHQFDRRELQRLFGQAKLQSGVLRAMSRPGTARPWFEYRISQLSEARIRGGIEYWQRHADLLARVSTEYGVPEEIIVATIGIETFYGRNTGSSPVFDSLTTLAFAYPPRADLVRSELEQFLLLTRELKVDPLASRGSYAGALGIAQFLPSSYRRHAVDFDGDGRRDLWQHADAIGSVANYYHSYGWQSGEPVIITIERQIEAASDEFAQLLERGIVPNAPVAVVKRSGMTPAEPVSDNAVVAVFSAEGEAGTRYWMGFNNFYVITRYNRSINYALAVYELAQELRRRRSQNRVE